MASLPANERLLTVPEAAEQLSINRSTLYRLIAANAVPYRRLPGTNSLRFTQSDIDAMLSAAYCPPVRASA